jgi:hypothetical protein
MRIPNTELKSSRATVPLAQKLGQYDGGNVFRVHPAGVRVSPSPLHLHHLQGSRQVCAQRAVLRIHDILMWIRIRGSMPLTNGSGWDPYPSIFIIDLQDANKKLIKFFFFFCILLFEGYFYIIFQR